MDVVLIPAHRRDTTLTIGCHLRLGLGLDLLGRRGLSGGIALTSSLLEDLLVLLLGGEESILEKVGV